MAVFPLPLSSFQNQDGLAEEILSQTKRILAHSLFARSPRLSQLLNFAVEMSVAGNAHSLKEYTIAVDVFKRADSFDCRLDSIVRVQVARLRKKLNHFYQAAGRFDRIILKLPSSGYEPLVSFRDDEVAFDSARPVVAVVGNGRAAKEWTRQFDPGVAELIHVSPDSLKNWTGRFDLVVVLMQPFESLSDYQWIANAATSRLSALLFVSNLSFESSLFQITKACEVLDAARSAEKPPQRHPYWIAASKSARPPIPIKFVA